MLAKTKLIYALSPQPQCLILDEPISGLDPAARDELLSLIRQLARQQNITTLMSSHSLYELADVATDLCIIHQGRNCLSASLDQIKENFACLEIRRPRIDIPPDLQKLIVQTHTDPTTV